MTCIHCSQTIQPCPRRCPLCRWLCQGWEHTTGTHYCTPPDIEFATPIAWDAVLDDPGYERYREMADAMGLDPWMAGAA